MLTVTGPGDDPTTQQIEVTKAGDVQDLRQQRDRHGGDAADAERRRPAGGHVERRRSCAGYTPVTWYATVAEGALVGNYAFGVSLEGGNTLDADRRVRLRPGVPR